MNSDANQLEADKAAPKRSLWKRLLLGLGCLMLLCLCILVLIFVIPNTNIFRFGDETLEKIEKRLPHN